MLVVKDAFFSEDNSIASSTPGYDSMLNSDKSTFDAILNR